MTETLAPLAALLSRQQQHNCLQPCTPGAIACWGCLCGQLCSMLCVKIGNIISFMEYKADRYALRQLEASVWH